MTRASDRLIAQAQGQIAAGELAPAAALLERARAEDPDNPRAALAEAQLTAARGDVEEAQAQVERLPIELAHDPEVAALRGRLQFAAALADAPAETELAHRLAADPKDSEARYQLAAHRAVAGDFGGALENLLELVKRDRAYGDDAGRKAMVAIFDLLGGAGELVTQYRARMMTALY
jgi:putative thioredoxin